MSTFHPIEAKGRLNSRDSTLGRMLNVKQPSDRQLYLASTHAVANNGRYRSVVIAEELCLPQVCGVEILRSMREEVETCDNKTISVAALSQ